MHWRWNWYPFETLEFSSMKRFIDFYYLGHTTKHSRISQKIPGLHLPLDTRSLIPERLSINSNHNMSFPVSPWPAGLSWWGRWVYGALRFSGDSGCPWRGPETPPQTDAWRENEMMNGWINEWINEDYPSLTRSTCSAGVLLMKELTVLFSDLFSVFCRGFAQKEPR